MAGFREESSVPPTAFVCSITLEIMSDPVFTSDGQTYERSAIEDWFREHETSPATGAVLPNQLLQPNIALRQAIEEWREKHPRDVPREVVVLDQVHEPVGCAEQEEQSPVPGDSDGEEGASDSEGKIWKVAAVGGAAGGAASGGVQAVGFGSSGIVAGSSAAGMMSASATAAGGGVASGGFVATLQSIGAAGLGSSSLAVACAGAALGACTIGGTVYAGIRLRRYYYSRGKAASEEKVLGEDAESSGTT
eukprot:CAMPEP_0181347122 /NCGR_PEP_ID=MMETSP1101-20121128/33711_1 /TAXON_ID=46948 /ORGANISM="Rhodomonas abbreviata, Strain Caron Lab Isolate" /LENGTH=248 /DNA_ID=CAMNT_0023459317 /DNA_START=54 /DNA_END=797 /DNA_ORIENTATION=+